ncbi:MAG: DUF4097 family beta strand repeat-containing protein [Clostridia bacterium]
MKNKFVIVLCCLLLVGGASFAVGLFLGGETSMWVSKDGVSFETEDEVEMVTQTLSSDIKNIDINIDISEEISVISGDTFTVSYDKAKYEIDIDDSALKVTQINDVFYNNLFLNFGINLSNNFNAVTVTIPEGMVIDNLNVNASVNNLEISNVNASKLDLYVNVGKVEIENSNFIDAYVEVDIGDVSIENCEFENNLKAIADIGDIDLDDCNILASAEFEIDIGNLELELIGSENDYTIKAKIDIGNFEMDGTKLDNEITFGNGNKKITIEVDTGNCDLDF